MRFPDYYIHGHRYSGTDTFHYTVGKRSDGQRPTPNYPRINSACYSTFGDALLQLPEGASFEVIHTHVMRNGVSEFPDEDFAEKVGRGDISILFGRARDHRFSMGEYWIVRYPGPDYRFDSLAQLKEFLDAKSFGPSGSLHHLIPKSNKHQKG